MKSIKNILNKYLLVFLDESLEKEYRLQELELTKKRIRIAVPFVFSIFVVSHILNLPTTFNFFDWVHILAPMVVGATVFLFTYSRLFYRIYLTFLNVIFVLISFAGIAASITSGEDLIFLYIRILFFTFILFNVFRGVIISYFAIFFAMFFIPYYLIEQNVILTASEALKTMPFLGILAFSFYIKQRASRLNFYKAKKLVKQAEELRQSHKQLVNDGAVGRILEGAADGSVSLDHFLENALTVILELPWLKSQAKGVIFIKNDDGNLEVKAVKSLEIIKNKCTLVKSGACLCGLTLENKKMIFDSAVPIGSDLCVDDMSTHGNYSMPLLFNEEILGVLNVYVERNHVKQKEEVVFLELVSKTIASVIHRFHIEKKKEEHRQELLKNKAVLESARKKLENDGAIGQILKNSTDTNLNLKVFLQEALEVVLDLSWLNIKSKGSIFVTNDDGNLEMIVGKDLGVLTTMCALIKPGQCLCGKALAQKKIIFENCVTANHDIEPEGMKPHGHFNIPLMLDNTVLGVLNVYVEHGHQKTQEEVDFFNLVGNTLATVMYRFKIEKEKELQRRELNRYYTAIEQSEATILFTDLKGTVNYANPYFYKKTGYTRDEILGASTKILSSGKTPRSTYEAMWENIKNKKTWQGEFYNKKKNGEEFIERAIISPVINPDGTVEEYIAVKNDITAYKKAIQRIKSQKDDIEEAHNKIQASIDYAKRIQDSLLKSSLMLNTVFDNVLVSYLPKETVSGDFYIARKQKDIITLAVADCTGHGVPGALVATLGILELSHILATGKNLYVSQILDVLTNKINEMLNNDNEIGSDGMDLALLRIDTKKQVIEYSGAKGILYLYQNNELIKLKTDRVSIGEKQKDLDFSFSYNQINYNKGDVLFVLTDGLIDQLSAVNKRRIGSKQVKELFNQLVKESYAQQKETLNAFINTHTSSVNQTDDITLITFKL